MKFSDKLKSLKINPIMEVREDFARNNVVGFRGVRENLGATTLASHIAIELGARGHSVCYVDLDFQNPNHFFSNDKGYTILDKINNTSLNIMQVINKLNYTNVTYIGARPQEPITTFLPLVVDSKYIEEKRKMYASMFDDLQSKFELVIVDIPSDYRIVEAMFGVQNCKLTFNLCDYDIACTTKMTKDAMLLADVVESDNLLNVVNVVTPFSFEQNYKEIDSRINVVTDIYQSKVIYDSASEKKLERNRIGTNKLSGARDINEDKYFKGINDIIEFMKGGNDNVHQVPVSTESTSVGNLD